MEIIWDRSGFTCVLQEDRPRYVTLMKSLLAKDFSYGLWGVHYNAPWYTRSPRSVDAATIKKLYGSRRSRDSIPRPAGQQPSTLATGPLSRRADAGGHEVVASGVGTHAASWLSDRRGVCERGKQMDPAHHRDFELQSQ
ncbi:hypothetical protein HPB51_007042 [Rhipicephalus microplus]|uniref:Uncharacterized protein n=1 Tax=Rhipicephalus microplus TaxID=6941 RepID=A0A9J6DZS6_RHIMP|nr:hypothetical protein HPB51_007042 [Rhipicephalus microplus]